MKLQLTEKKYNMTREEAKQMFRDDKDSYGKPRAIMSKIDKIYDDFEAENKQTIGSNLDLDKLGAEVDELLQSIDEGKIDVTAWLIEQRTKNK